VGNPSDANLREVKKVLAVTHPLLFDACRFAKTPIHKLREAGYADKTVRVVKEMFSMRTDAMSRRRTARISEDFSAPIMIHLRNRNEIY
jgi:tryptophanase